MARARHPGAGGAGAAGVLRQEARRRAGAPRHHPRGLVLSRPSPTAPTSAAFRRFWRAGAVSGLGSYVTVFSLQALVVLTLHGTATDVGWLNAARWLPYLVFGLVVGAVVDGRRRLPLMVGTDLAQAGLLLVVPLLWWLGALSLPALLVIVVLTGTAAVVGGAAEMSFLPRLLEPRHLQPAHARIDGTDAAASTAGPALGGVLVNAVGAPLAVLLDSVTYVYSALTLRRIVVDEPVPRTGVTVRGLATEVVEGVRWVYRSSGLATIAVATHAWFVGNAIIGVVLAPYALVTLGLTAFQFGIAGAAGGVGAVVGAVLTTRVGRLLGTGRTIITCHVITTAGVVALVLAGHGGVPALPAVLTGQFLYGLAMGMSNSHEMSYRQLMTPDGLQARTNTTLRSFNRAVAMVVAPLAGMLADSWGITPTLLVAAGVFALVAIGLSLSPFRTVRAPA
ncbi:MFS transporter [Terrabacter sp. NPDC080008]|uniref:MFS transporter n=1 Tax=Terrabacter sp. NPDC080008 TaxID=3155176 RepID=UPI00344E2FEB